MHYISTRKNNECVSFKEAVINGLSSNGGLYFPKVIPQLPRSFFEHIETLDNHEMAFRILHPFVKDTLAEEPLKRIISGTLAFPTPVVPVEKDVFALELFHGPTRAFKDVGARFMSRCLSHFYTGKNKKVTVLVATSGDTGSAVASGFFDVPGVSVKILFPEGKVSPYQEYQMTSMGKNILAIAVDGTFDDCQHLVKEALNDSELKSKISLSSANSINVARLLPQMLYYFFAYKQLKPMLKGKKMVVAVPSGNLGNITAGLMAKKMGLPVDHFIAALNANDTFLQYLNTGIYEKKASVPTCSNAMDVGNPSNFERIEYLYHNNINLVRKHLSSYSFDDDATLREIKRCFEKNNYLPDPHGAVGKLALARHAGKDTVGVFLETAHPQKFSGIISNVIPSFRAPEVNLNGCRKYRLKNKYEALKKLILAHRTG